MLDAERALAIPGDDDVADLLTRAEALRERARGLANLVAERHRGFERELAAVADEGVVETLVAEAASLREQLAAVDADFASLAPTRTEVDAAEQRVAELASAGVAGRRRGRAPRRATRSRTARAARGRASRPSSPKPREQLAAVARDLYALAPEMAEAQAAEDEAARVRAELDAHAEVAPEMTFEAQERRAAEEQLHDADARWRETEADATRWRARADTLLSALDAAHAAAGGDAIVGRVDGVVGPLVDHVEIEAGAEIAVAAALGDALNAIVVEGDHVARARDRAPEARRRQGAAARGRRRTAVRRACSRRPGSRPLGACVRGTRPGLDRVLAHLLAPFVLVDGGWTAALDLALAAPGVVAVTREGDRFGGASPWRAGPPGSSVVTPAALAEAEAAAATAAETRARRRRAPRRTIAARARRGPPRRVGRSGTRTRPAHRARPAHGARRGAAPRRRSAQRVARGAADDAATEGRRPRSRSRRRIPDALDRAARAASPRPRASPTRHARNAPSSTGCARRPPACARTTRCAAPRSRSGAPCSASGSTDVEARLAARPDEEAKARARRSRARTAAAGRDRRSPTGSRRSRPAIEQLAERLRKRRQEQSDAAREAGRRLDGLRRERAEAEKQLTRAARARRAGSRSKRPSSACGSNRPSSASATSSTASPMPRSRRPMPEVPEGITLAARARELERELRLMGPVNPLALSEYEALVERHEFLQQQLDDVKNTRRELARVIKAVDEEIVTVFESAFADVSRHFDELFSMLFPGGSGRLVLTEPHDMLNTGIEMEARPSGKMVRRLSLLSGGERSLAALAYLFSVFRARPSPFYLMDEVEAALDDVNLHRFLDLVHEFRNEAQLLIVSHQKRTMEAADVLYGVSMPPGGSSRVVSQRIRDLELEDV